MPQQVKCFEIHVVDSDYHSVNHFSFAKGQFCDDINIVLKSLQFETDDDQDSLIFVSVLNLSSFALFFVNVNRCASSCKVKSNLNIVYLHLLCYTCFDFSEVKFRSSFYGEITTRLNLHSTEKFVGLNSSLDLDFESYIMIHRFFVNKSLFLHRYFSSQALFF